MRKYVKTHEWIEEIEEGVFMIGLTNHAQEELGDIVFVDLPQVGDNLVIGKAFAVIESVKAVSEAYAPVDGVVAEINEELSDSPALINEAAATTWLIKAEDVTAMDELLSEDEYLASL